MVALRDSAREQDGRQETLTHSVNTLSRAVNNLVSNTQAMVTSAVTEALRSNQTSFPPALREQLSNIASKHDTLITTSRDHFHSLRDDVNALNSRLNRVRETVSEVQHRAATAAGPQPPAPLAEDHSDTPPVYFPPSTSAPSGRGGGRGRGSNRGQGRGSPNISRTFTSGGPQNASSSAASTHPAHPPPTAAAGPVNADQTVVIFGRIWWSRNTILSEVRTLITGYADLSLWVTAALDREPQFARVIFANRTAAQAFVNNWAARPDFVYPGVTAYIL